MLPLPEDGTAVYVTPLLPGLTPVPPPGSPLPALFPEVDPPAGLEGPVAEGLSINLPLPSLYKTSAMNGKAACTRENSAGAFSDHMR